MTVYGTRRKARNADLIITTSISVRRQNPSARKRRPAKGGNPQWPTAVHPSLSLRPSDTLAKLQNSHPEPSIGASARPPTHAVGDFRPPDFFCRVLRASSKAVAPAFTGFRHVSLQQYPGL